MIVIGVLSGSIKAEEPADHSVCRLFKVTAKAKELGQLSGSGTDV